LAFVGRVLQSLFGGRSRVLASARRAERHGELEIAAALYERGGRPDEASRVRKARALAALTGRAVPVTSSARREMAAIAAELESLGEFARAAEAYANTGDLEGQARALAQAGEVDRLDELLAASQTRSHEEHARRGAHDLFAMLVAAGKRRDAVALARASSDEGLRSRGRAVEAKRVTGPVVRVLVRGRVTTLVLGERVAIGRAQGPAVEPPDDGPSTSLILVPSSALSRRHLAIARRDGGVWVRDLGSHNGTTLRAAPLTDEIAVGDGLELRLGREVSLVVRPAEDWPGAVALEVAGSQYVVPLGPARLGLGEWHLESARVHRVPPASAAAVEIGDPVPWIDLVTGEQPPAFFADLQLAPRVSLLVGDALAAERGGEPVLTLLGPGG
jgi:hypothetical protein